MTDDKTQAETKQKVLELVDRASLERLQAITSLLNLSDDKAVAYGDALSLLTESDYNIGTLKIAIAKVKDEQGLQIVRTRTTVRVFKYLIDEDDPDGGYMYRGFYVSMITPEQKIAISASAVTKLQTFIAGQNITDKELQKNPQKMIEFIQSDEFVNIMIEPNKQIREIILANMFEVRVGEDCKVIKPLQYTDKVMANPDGTPIFPELSLPPVPEFILLQLEDDLRLLMEQQGVMAKNLPMTDMFAL